MKLKKVVLTFIVGILLQAGIYYYLDTVLFAATSDYQIGSTNQQEAMGFGVVPDGQAYYSFDKRFMATVVGDTVTIYQAGKKGEPQRVSLHGRKLSFFEWLPDRNLAIFASYGRDDRTDQYGVYIAQYNPLAPERELDTEIENAPYDSKIVDVAYSVATNVVYMKLEVGENKYRIYRTDANYDTRRIPVQAENIGRIAVFYDRDVFSMIICAPVSFICSKGIPARGVKFLRTAVSALSVSTARRFILPKSMRTVRLSPLIAALEKGIYENCYVQHAGRFQQDYAGQYA